MAEILRVTTRWDGFLGAPGFTNLFFRDFDTDTNPDAAQVSSAINKVAGFFGSIAPLLPAAARLQVQRNVDVLESTTGTLVNSIGFTGTLNAIAGTATGAIAGPAGAVVNWATGNVRNGRRIRGRTFLVPLAVTSYETDGTLTATAINTIQDAATTLVGRTGNPDFGVWARPTQPLMNDGIWVAASGATVPDTVAVLRSRRD